MSGKELTEPERKVVDEVKNESLIALAKTLETVPEMNKVYQESDASLRSYLTRFFVLGYYVGFGMATNEEEEPE